MGCCSTHPDLRNSPITAEELKTAIDKRRLKFLLQLKTRMIKSPENQSIIDLPFAFINNVRVSPLGYCLISGNFKVFNYFLTTLGASLQSLEHLLHSQSSSIIEVICFYGYSDFLAYFLPIYMNGFINLHSTEQKNLSFTIDLDLTCNNEEVKKKRTTPIHIAAERNHLHIIDLVRQYFKEVNSIPYTLDLDYLDESTGENCALIACRKGHFSLLKYLYETCKVDFYVKNKRNESALVITAIHSKRNQNDVNYKNIFVYLIDTVGLGFESEYEEILLALEDIAIIEYFSKKLRKAGISIDKQNIEDKFEIINYNKPLRREEARNKHPESLCSIEESFISRESSVKRDSRISLFLSSFLSFVSRSE